VRASKCGQESIRYVMGMSKEGTANRQPWQVTNMQQPAVLAEAVCA
jgi:hypothetical protein